MRGAGKAILLALLGAGFACGDGSIDPSLGPNFSSGPVEALVEDLRNSGATVAPSGVAILRFFAVSGVRLSVDGEQIEAYTFATAEGAAGAASGVSADGSKGTGNGIASNILWVATPHFFHESRLIVLYVGDVPELLQLLEMTLGPQFAGA